ncbi:MAG TPA: A/G-specific adenine glycosylase [Caulobacteraceae bacterium]|nr:A/G-specific adenine glycosylase [Caulobacteraceae bacterium]
MAVVSPNSRITPVSKIRSGLLAWYDAHRRDLPWRARPGEAADPYRVWLSEIMLQQTTVPHATPYYRAFLARWPTVAALAAAADAEVMAAWAGLGYYARARNLLACARAVASDHAGAFPTGAAALRGLPGVGAYTAAAVAAIAFDAPANVVDGNVERVMARLFAVETPLPTAKPELAALAARLVTSDRPGDWAQALMDLGALVCRPKAPLCEACPLSSFCVARAAGAPESYPRRAAKGERPHRHGVAFVLTRGDQVALALRPPKGLLGGMLGLPTTPWRAAPWTDGEAFAYAPEAGSWRAIGAVRHVFTHFSLDLRVLTAPALRAADGRGGPLVWKARASAASDTPSLFRKALALL